jgi:hypothetical protein
LAFGTGDINPLKRMDEELPDLDGLGEEGIVVDRDETLLDLGGRTASNLEDLNLRIITVP